MNKGHIVIRSYLFGAVFLLLLWWGIALLLDLPVIPAPDKVLLKLVRIFLSRWPFMPALASGALPPVFCWPSSSAIRSAL